MGKATRWFKVLLQGIKGSDSTRSSDSTPPPKEKRRWSFVKSYREKSSSNPNSRHSSDAANLPSIPRIQSPAVSGYVADDPNDASKHAIVVAAASAAAAEAAVAAAQAAAAVVRLTSSGRRTNPPSSHLTTVSGRDKRAAIVIQSHFRGYLARRALKALKGLVKLQALVRGHIMRKKTAETMRGIQAMLRAQARARAVRAYDSPSSSGKSSHIHHPGPPTPEKFELTSHIRNTKSNESTMLKGNGTRSSHRVLIHPDKGYVNSTRSGPQLGESMYGTVGRHANHMEDYYSRPDKILEIDTGGKTCRPQFFPKHGKSPFQFGSDQLAHSFTTTSKDSSPISGEIQSGLKPNTFRKLSVQEDEDEEDDGAFCTAENSPQLYSRRRRGGGTHTPTKSDASATSCFSGYSDCPSYMSYTESSIAKVRSLSAPKQRPPQQQQRYERASSTKRWSVHQQRHASFASKAYPGSGHLDRLGMPVRNDNAVVYYSGYLN